MSIAHSTSTIGFGTSIQPVYLQHPVALAMLASFLYEVAGRVCDGVEVWFDAGVTNPIVVPSSTSGVQARAIQGLFDAHT